MHRVLGAQTENILFALCGLCLFWILGFLADAHSQNLEESRAIRHPKQHKIQEELPFMCMAEISKTENSLNHYKPM